MTKKFIMTETIHSEKVHTTRFGTTGAGNQYDDKEVGKAMKFSGDSAHVLCVAGDPIGGFMTSAELGLFDGFSIGGLVKTGYKEVTFDGLQATPGTGTIAVGDLVVAGTMVAKGTALSGPQKVCKATTQVGTTEAAAVGDVNDMFALARAQWRVVSLGEAGTGAVGTTGTIERV